MKRISKWCPNDYEHAYWPQGKMIVGIDEAGRGPLAGPLSVAGVVFPSGYENFDIYDSKALSEKKREEMYKIIMEDALWFEILEISVEEIDRLNILEADRKAMKQIAEDAPAEIILTDAMSFQVNGKTTVDLIKGDQKSVSIAAGSILAKVTRDRIMVQYSKEYPEYGFEKNKGYGTKQHMEAIHAYGITPIHRRSYAPVRVVQEELKL
ncbi:MAG: ribonuclease HII [Erysipelotrichaceae bacterium]|nr:ribonuclease HII [Erysipelotrichaceae bacterium]